MKGPVELQLGFFLSQRQLHFPGCALPLFLSGLLGVFEFFKDLFLFYSFYSLPQYHLVFSIVKINLLFSVFLYVGLK